MIYIGIDIAFPELSNFFKGNLHIKSSYALLSKYPSAKVIANTRIDALTNLLYFLIFLKYFLPYFPPNKI